MVQSRRGRSFTGGDTAYGKAILRQDCSCRPRAVPKRRDACISEAQIFVPGPDIGSRPVRRNAVIPACRSSDRPANGASDGSACGVLRIASAGDFFRRPVGNASLADRSP